MKYCTKCGHRLNDEDSFCSRCGAVQEKNRNNSSKKYSKKAKQPKIMGNLLCISIAMTCIGGLVTYLSVFHNFFGGLSGFAAVVGGFILLAGFTMLIMLLGDNHEVIDKSFEESRARQEKEWEIRRANRIWNEEQRNNDRRYKK